MTQMRRPSTPHILILIAALAVAVSSLFMLHAAAEDTFRFGRMWPTLQQPWYFGTSADVAVDARDNVYIADRSLERVLKFTRDGQLITQWGSGAPGVGNFFRPDGIALDENGFVYTIQYETFYKFTPDGEFISKQTLWDQGDGPNFFTDGIAVDHQFNIYLTGRDFWIQKRSPDGAFIRQWGGIGTDPGQFAHAGKIAVDDAGYVYVTDGVRRDIHGEGVEEFRNDRIQVFTPDGAFVRTWGATGYGEGEFYDPKAIAIGPQGNVYVTDTTSRAQKFTPNGEFITRWTGYDETARVRRFKDGVGLAVDRSGTVTVADSIYGRIARYAGDGRFLTAWSARGSDQGWFDEPSDVEQAPDGNLYVVDSENRRIQVFTTDGRFLFQWGSRGSEAGQFAFPRGIAIDAAGNVYVTDQNGYRVQKFTATGEFILMWGANGTGPGEFRRPTGVDVDAAGNVYVADDVMSRIQKFTPQGEFLLAWGHHGIGDGEFQDAEDVAVAPDGSVYVTDWLNPIVQKFTPTGEFLQSWWLWNGMAKIAGIDIDAQGNVYVAEWDNSGIEKYDADMNLLEILSEKGSNPGQVSFPWGLCVGSNGEVYVTDLDLHRVQQFRSVSVADRGKAVIVAGGGPFPGNNLWDATQFCANFAYRALVHQGFTKESIYYLSADVNLDLDGNGEPDDVDADATNENFEFALTQWAADADDLVIYMVDHGGTDKFRTAAAEILTDQDLARWLDQAQKAVTGVVTLVYDACQSGSFLTELAAPGRIVITSAAAEENAYFLSTGTISFSNFFWTQVFNGYSVLESFDVAAEAIGQTVDFQTPQRADAGNLAIQTFIGNGTFISGEAPSIDQVSPPQTIANASSADLFADAADPDGTARVWAVIRPPDYRPPSPDNPVQNLPILELFPAQEDRWEGTYTGFTSPGTYTIAIYARDQLGNTSRPALTSVAVDNPLRRRAILVAAGAQTDPNWPTVQAAAELAYEALRFQGYADDDIRFYSPVTFSTGVDGANSLDNVQAALTQWAAQQTRDVVLHLVGDGLSGDLILNPVETLRAVDLDTWLDALQAQIPGVVTVVYDAPQSGASLPDLRPPEAAQRIVLASAGANQAPTLALHPNISFSAYFWRQILNGASVNTAFTHARIAMEFSADGQGAEMDDNGDGVFDTKTDGQLAKNHILGAGIVLAGDDPLVGQVSPPQTLSGFASATIWADQVTTTGEIEAVYAFIARPVASSPTNDVDVIRLGKIRERYQATYRRFLAPGTYAISVIAIDREQGVSLPVTTEVIQTRAAGVSGCNAGTAGVTFPQRGLPEWPPGDALITLLMAIALLLAGRVRRSRRGLS